MPSGRSLLRCETCGEPPPFAPDGPCSQCGLQLPDDGSLLDFLGTPERPVPEPEVNAFYEKRPFPGYSSGDTATTLLDRCRQSPYLVELDAGIPPDALVLDAGCGTGQISNFLGLAGPRRTVVGADACHASLSLASGFRTTASIHNVTFLRGDLFHLPLPEAAFDVVHCRGVVHHTPDPDRAVRCVARHVKPGGYLVLGFYESLGRAFHRFRQRIAAARGGKPVRFLDPILRRRDLEEGKKLTWIADQYHHPLEWCPAYPRMQKDVEEAGFEVLRSVPPVPTRGAFFEAGARTSNAGMLMRRLGWACALGDEDAGLVCLVARRKG